MARPRLYRKVNFDPDVTCFKPQGVPMRFLEITELTIEELEAYRLRHLNDLNKEKLLKKCILQLVLIKEYFIQLIKK